MKEPEKESGGTTPNLPSELIDWLDKPIARFLRIETAAGATLVLSSAVALLLANSPWGGAFLRFWETEISIRAGALESSRSLREWINDGLMTLFFFVIALELKRELILGDMRNPRMAALSISAALGGMAVPALVYLGLQAGRVGQEGWGTVMATDTAFVIACLALLGTRIPQSLRIFMLSLAIVDDIGAILVVAIGYGHDFNWMALAIALFTTAILFAMARLGVRHLAVYFLAGIVIWIVVDASGLHATVTGVVLGLMTPTRRWVSDDLLHAILDRVIAYPPGDHWSGDTKDRKHLRMAEAAARESLSPVERLELMLHPWVSFAIMPLFALANAGVPIAYSTSGASVTAAVFFGFTLGKPIGVFVFSWIAVRTGLAMRPPDLRWIHIAAGGLLAGIGFTMALFIANLAFNDDLINDAKLGILSASVFSAVAGILLLRWKTKR